MVRSKAKSASCEDTNSTSSDDRTIADVSVNENSIPVYGHSMHGSASQSLQQHDASRLSQDLEPMSIGERQQSVPDNKAFTADDLNPLGQHVKAASAAMATLEALGLNNLDISIPRCIVLGQQSTGKSSVIEAISGIKTPRDTGTCTCCPLYITMQPSGDLKAKWSAKISLQRDYVLDMRIRASTEYQPPQQYPTWIPAQSSEQIAFAQTSSQTELETLIRRAQAANLSPFEDPASFRTSIPTTNHRHRSKFSPNIVRIDITDVGLPTLNFFDLPGIISQAELEDEEYTVPLVENLVAGYVKQPGSLILVTCDLGTDIANSTAAALARKHKAIDRCIGVLTKPDLLPRGTPDEAIADILDGKRFKLGHEYFVVKNLDKKEIQKGFNHREARKMEAKFFASGRWSSALRRFQPRFGTSNLQTYLSKQLAKQTLQTLPVLDKQISTRLNEVRHELFQIPDTPAHSAVRTITDALLSFSATVRYEMEGEHEHTSWRNVWEAIQNAFNDSLEAMKPSLTLKGELDKGLFLSTLPGQSAAEPFLLDTEDKDDCDETRLQETPKKRKRDEPTPTPSPFKTPSKTAARTSQAKRLPTRHHVSIQLGDLTQYKKQFKLDDVRSHVSQKSKSKVPGEVHPKVKESLMRSAFENWDVPIELFFSRLEKELRMHMVKLFSDSLDKWKGTELYQNTWLIVGELLKNNLNEQKTLMAMDSLNDELDGPYIFFRDQYRREKDSVLDMYRQGRRDTRFKVLVAEAGHHYDRAVSQEEQEKFRKDSKKMAVVEQEPYAKEVELVSDIRAYYNIAARRLHDSVCMRIESKFFKRLRFELRAELENNLGIYDDQQGTLNAQRLLAKSPERERRRQELVAMQHALEKGLSCLKELQSKYGCGSQGNNDGTDSQEMGVGMEM